tara:strand:- start:1552 stop:2211 length:660 start_codon:yes stop_codon:yes gene_type:complete
MHETVKKLKHIEEIVNFKEKDLNLKKKPFIIAVSKTFKMDKIVPLIDEGHRDFGENKVQEAMDKWNEIKSQNEFIRLHLLGGLQTNKVKFAVKIFDFIHSVDSKKLAKKIREEEIKQNKKIKIFLQVNIGNENQKFGISRDDLDDLFLFCKEIDLDVVGLMCIPPVNLDPDPFFKELKNLNDKLNLTELSMGMSSDYKKAIENCSTFLRIGSDIFGKRD